MFASPQGVFHFFLRLSLPLSLSLSLPGIAMSFGILGCGLSLSPAGKPLGGMPSLLNKRDGALASPWREVVSEHCTHSTPLHRVPRGRRDHHQCWSGRAKSQPSNAAAPGTAAMFFYLYIYIYIYIYMYISLLYFFFFKAVADPFYCRVLRGETIQSGNSVGSLCLRQQKPREPCPIALYWDAPNSWNARMTDSRQGGGSQSRLAAVGSFKPREAQHIRLQRLQLKTSYTATKKKPKPFIDTSVQ